MKLKEFNLEIALKDPSQVVRGDGKQVVYLTERNSENNDYLLSVCFKDKLGNLDTQTYTKEGIFSLTIPQNIQYNLFLKPKETTYWYNIYKNDTTGKIWMGDCYLSNIDAFDEIPTNPQTTIIKTESFTIEE